MFFLKRQNKKVGKNNCMKLFIKLFLYSLLSISILFFIFTFSIIPPIIIKPFYYYHLAHFDYKSIDFNNGQMDYNQLKSAYDELFNYLIFNKKFGTGELDFSQSGMQHFEDVRRLFMVNFIVFGVTLFIIILVLIVSKLIKQKISFIKSGFIASIILLLLIVIISIFAVRDFEFAFRKFHEIFFPGKTNWNFNPDTDEIIKILPITFFRDSAIFITILIFAFVLFFIFFQVIIFLRNYKRKER
ncbi:TIGR01906 family membrane protein [Mycoplasmopsis cynos]|uniref:TIGR01906 family membrane protein n=1 Tax=Mycoplasmopsis cynos TaxID=171284 RepID=UPI00220E3E54|nr:TIGR01906 family membrane protein [Mycoplasmopsis cynos]UWV80605.1 TIGR01906 family membrane protein [Mycoplasmopsis cynos]